MMDSRNRRASAIGVGLAFVLVLPHPDGAVSQPDRQQCAYCYSGITAAAPVTTTWTELQDSDSIWTELQDSGSVWTELQDSGSTWQETA